MREHTGQWSIAPHLETHGTELFALPSPLNQAQIQGALFKEVVWSFPK